MPMQSKKYWINMKMTGEQLLFLMQVLKDSLDIQMGYDWSFNHKKDQRKAFYDKFIELLISQQSIETPAIDISTLK
jgi:hypothetical protein